MKTEATTLRPGLLVSLHTKLEGGVRYEREDLDANATEAGAKIERWKTTKVTEDPEEHAAGVKVRGKVGSLIRSVCAHTSFGLLCPRDKEKSLDEAISEARALAATFNAKAKTTGVSVFVLKGYIAETDTEAARAIASDLRGLLDEMKAGVASADVGRIRDAALRAKRMGAMLDDATAKRVKAAIEEARKVAREIVKAGDDARQVIQQVKLEAVDSARFAFLDMEEAATKDEGEALPPVEARALDVEDDEERQKVLPLPMVQVDLPLDDEDEEVPRKAMASENVTAMIWPEES